MKHGVHIYVPDANKNQIENLFVAVNSLVENCSFSTVDATDNGVEEVWVPVTIEEFRDQYPKTVIGRATVDQESDPMEIRIEVWNPEYVGKLITGMSKNLSICSSDY